MLPDRVSNPGPLTYESGALPIALRGLAIQADLSLLGIDSLLFNVHHLMKLLGEAIIL